MPEITPTPQPAPTGASFTSCKNCHSPMPSDLRFCRNCGYRMGEGTAEYTETVRFNNPPVGTYAGVATVAPSGVPIRRRRRRISGMGWIFITMAMVFVVGGGLSQIVPHIPRGSFGGGAGMSAGPVRPFAGVSGFENAEGGVTFENTEPPGSPADKAGLVGGDIITNFDGQPVADENQMMKVLRGTPIGKTVEVSYLRDGESRTTKLTIISSIDADQLTRAFRGRPEGQGQLGIGDWKRVEVPGTKLHGVQLTVSQNSPADIAGLKTGDIVIAFDSIPIRTSDELVARIRRAIPYSIVKIAIIRGNEHLEIPVKIGRR